MTAWQNPWIFHFFQIWIGVALVRDVFLWYSPAQLDQLFRSQCLGQNYGLLVGIASSRLGPDSCRHISCEHCKKIIINIYWQTYLAFMHVKMPMIQTSHFCDLLLDFFVTSERKRFFLESRYMQKVCINYYYFAKNLLSNMTSIIFKFPFSWFYF